MVENNTASCLLKIRNSSQTQPMVRTTEIVSPITK